MLNQHFAVGMSKVSDALTCSSQLNPPLIAEEGNAVIRATKALEKAGSKLSSKREEGFAELKKYPLVDLNWLCVLIEHFQVDKEEEW